MKNIAHFLSQMLIYIAKLSRFKQQKKFNCQTETEYLLHTPSNAQRLRDSIAHLNAGRSVKTG